MRNPWSKHLGSASPRIQLSLSSTERPYWYLDDALVGRTGIFSFKDIDFKLHIRPIPRRSLYLKDGPLLPGAIFRGGICMDFLGLVCSDGGANAISAPLLTQSVSAQKISHQWPLGLPSHTHSQSKDLTGIRIKSKRWDATRQQLGGLSGNTRLHGGWN